ncbi:Vacuolar protein sorting-associated protein 8 [Clonorchis sinensis]|uniref:Vacuolar protein sorting-associated protein 8 n=1 Tax=Clonorchis sinensis TaxID=79923 RepID=A0A8T1M7J4_CLOSI|nr:Vacuolar protein sorting-associated protein 8 [Clonorchis sinensis]
MNNNHFESPTISSPDVTSLAGSLTSEDRLDSDIEADLQQTRIAAAVERFSLASSDALLHGSVSGAVGAIGDTVSQQSSSLTAGGDQSQSTFFQYAMLSGISSQLNSLSSKMDIGSPSCLSYRTHLIIGTTKGVIFVFSLRQVLRFCFGCSGDQKDANADLHGSVTSLCQNRDGSLLLSGYSSGRIAVWQLTAPAPSTCGKDKATDETTAEDDSQGAVDLSFGSETSHTPVKSLTSRLSSLRAGSGSATDRFKSRLLCVVDDAHGVDQAIHFCLFTTVPSLAVCVDTGGSVFQLHFKRGLTGLKREAVCFFSGSRGEICGLDTLGSSSSYAEHLAGCVAGDAVSQSSSHDKIDFLRSASAQSLASYALVAMASFTKLVIATLRPRIQIVYWQPLRGPASCLPLLSWQWDHRYCACSCSSRAVLAFGRGSVVHLLRAVHPSEVPTNRNLPAAGALHFELTHTIELSYNLLALNWISSKNQMIALDNASQLHLLDSSNGGDIEVLDLSSVGISLNSELFKGLEDQGLISEALASAGKSACAHSISVYGSKMVVLGSDGIHVFAMRTWVAIVKSLFLHGLLETALSHCDNALVMLQSRESLEVAPARRLELSLPEVPSIPEFPLSLSSLRIQIASLLRKYMLPLFSDWPESSCSVSFAVIRAVVSIGSRVDSGELIFNDFYPLVETVDEWQSWFFVALVQLIRTFPILGVLSGEKLISLCDDNSKDPALCYAVPPTISMNLLEWCLTPSKQCFRATYLEQDSVPTSHGDPGRVWAEQCLLRLPPACIDLNQAVKLCWNHQLYTAYLHLYTNILMDFETPFKQLIECLDEENKGTQISIPSSQSDCGQHLLLLIRAAFAAESSSHDALPSPLCVDAPTRIFNLLLSESTVTGESKRLTYPRFPRLRLLLQYNAVDFLNMLTLSISSDSFFQEGELGLAHRTHLLHKLIACTLQSALDHSPSFTSFAAHVFQFIVHQLTLPDNRQIEIEESKLFELSKRICSDNGGRTEKTSLLFQSAVIELMSMDRFTDLEACLTLAQEAGLNYICEYIHRVRGDRFSAFRDQLNELEHFEATHPGFTTQLSDSYPELSQMAEQVFVFLEQVFPSDGKVTQAPSDMNMSPDDVSCLRGTIVEKLEVFTMWDAERTLRILYNIFGSSISELLLLLFPEFSLYQSGKLGEPNDREIKNFTTCLSLLRVYFRCRQTLQFRLHSDDNPPDEPSDLNLSLLTQNNWDRFLMELEPSVSEYFVYLISRQSSCQEVSLMPFLLENLSTYRPSVVLQMLSVERHPNEMAYLYETLGDLEKAAKLYESTFLKSWNSHIQSHPSNSCALSTTDSLSPNASAVPSKMLPHLIDDVSRASADSWFAFCQRQTSQDDISDKRVKEIWFHVIDVLLGVQASLTDSRLISEMNEVFHLLMSYIPSSISLPTIVSYVLQSANKENAAKFDDKTNALVTRLVATCQFEADQMMLNTQLARTDLTSLLSSALTRFGRGFGTTQTHCALCAVHLRSSLVVTKHLQGGSSGNTTILFRCGHVFHTACLQGHSSTTDLCAPVLHWSCPLCEPRPNDSVSVPPHVAMKASVSSAYTNSLPTLPQDDPILIDTPKPHKTSNPFDD